MDIDYYITNSTSARLSMVWIPYLQEVKSLSKREWRLIFNGGEIDVDLSNIELISIFGISDADIPLTFLYACESNGVALCFYTRNKGSRIILNHTNRSVNEDIITKQILCRQDSRTIL